MTIKVIIEIMIRKSAAPRSKQPESFGVFPLVSLAEPSPQFSSVTSVSQKFRATTQNISASDNNSCAGQFSTFHCFSVSPLSVGTILNSDFAEHRGTPSLERVPSTSTFFTFSALSLSLSLTPPTNRCRLRPRREDPSLYSPTETSTSIPMMSLAFATV